MLFSKSLRVANLSHISGTDVNQPTQKYRIGEFVLTVPQLQLVQGDVPVKLGGRALNLLAALAEAGGDLVTHDALLARVWPNQTIDESAIRVHLSAARKALSKGGNQDNIIVSEAGRGYRLMLPVEVISDRPVVAASYTQPEPVRNGMPGRLSSIVGRDDAIAVIANDVIERRFITLSGPGGIGKTTVAIAVGKKIAADRGLGSHFVDLAPVSDQSLVAGAVASALGLPSGGQELPRLIASHLLEHPALLILDNCEQVVDAVALLSEELFERAPELMLLATSREPLRAQGEWVHRLSALKVPSDQDEFDLSRLEEFPAISLFAQRALAANLGFRLSDANAPAIIGICRALDGIPLAIEFAAARCDHMAPEAILSGLEDRFALLSRGRRTALPRHRTLRGALDWSYGLLDPVGQIALRRISVFRSSFSTEAAAAVTNDLGLTRIELMEVLADLISKSLVNPSGDGEYKLLDTTRYYGIEQLDDAGEGEKVRLLHAQFLLQHLEDSAQGWEGNALRSWLATYSRSIADVRAALQWTRGDGGNLALAVQIQIKSAVLWFHLSLAREYLSHAEAALAGVSEEAVPDELLAELLLGYGHALWHIRGPVTEMGEAFCTAQTIAERIGNEALKLRASWGVWAHAILAGDYHESLSLAQHFSAAIGESSDLGSRQTALHMEALSLHFSGQHDAALDRLTAVLAGDAAPERANHANHALVDGKIAALSLLARLKWQQGDTAAALSLAREVAVDIDLVDHALSTCYGLAIGCIPVAIASGDLILAQTWIARLRSVTGRFDLDHWALFARGFGAALDGTDAACLEASHMQAEMFLVAADPAVGIAWNSVGRA